MRPETGMILSVHPVFNLINSSAVTELGFFKKLGLGSGSGVTPTQGCQIENRFLRQIF